MTPPPAMATDVAWSESTVTPEFQRRSHVDDTDSSGQSYSVYSEEVLRRAADTVMLNPRHELELRRLMRAGPAGVLAVLDEAARTPREEILHVAAETLAQLSESPSGFERIVLEAIGHPSPVKRALAVRALGYSCGTKVGGRVIIERALHDRHPEVREVAANALSELGDSAAAPALKEALRAERVDYIADALQEALDELGG